MQIYNIENIRGLRFALWMHTRLHSS